MGGGEPDEGPSSQSDNPMTIKGEVMWPPLFVIRLIGLLGFLG
jgi:hypothetical protein